MNEWWNWFKEIPASVKIKYVIALPKHEGGDYQ